MAQSLTLVVTEGNNRKLVIHYIICQGMDEDSELLLTTFQLESLIDYILKESSSCAHQGKEVCADDDVFM